MPRISGPGLIFVLSTGCTIPCDETEIAPASSAAETIPVEFTSLNAHDKLVTALEGHIQDIIKAPQGCPSDLDVWISESKAGRLIGNPDYVSPDLVAVRIGLSVDDAPEVSECKQWIESISDLDSLYIATADNNYLCERTDTDVVRPFPHRLIQQDIVITFTCFTQSFPASEVERFSFPLQDPNSFKSLEQELRWH